MVEPEASGPVELSERSGGVVASEEAKGDARRARAAAAASEPQPEDGTQTEAIAAIEGDDEFAKGTWHGHKNHQCPHCHVAFLDIQGGSAAVRAHIRDNHRGLNRA
jgi:hypothetical protein